MALNSRSLQLSAKSWTTHKYDVYLTLNEVHSNFFSPSDYTDAKTYTAELARMELQEYDTSL